MEMDVTRLSASLTVRRLEETDVLQILALCGGNPQYYRYHPPLPSADGIREDMRALPPGKAAEDKFYVGYFAGGALAAAFSLCSQRFDAVICDGALVVTTYGYGDGLGLSQYGAYLLAKNGQTYKDILLHYYRGAEISAI